jgi:hypothetical protein
MGLYTKIDLFSFADFYHRYATIGFTMDELLWNFQQYKERPRDLMAPERLKKPKLKPDKPSHKLLREILANAASLCDVTIEAVNGNSHERVLVTPRQLTCYVAMQCGFDPADIWKVLKWDRSGNYHRAKKAAIYAQVDKDFRHKLNLLLDKFGQPEFSA